MGPEQTLFKVYHGVILVIFAVAFVYAWITVFKLRNVSTAYNAWLLPFACFSLSSWILWVLQYLISLANSLNYPQTDFLQKTGLCLAGMQIALWTGSVLPLRSKKSPGMLLTLALWIMLSIVIAFATYQTRVITSQSLAYIEAVSSAVVFWVVASAIVQLRHSRIFAGVFFLHGFCQWFWASLWIKPLSETRLELVAFPLWHIALLLAWIPLISEMLVKLRVMISSTEDDLLQERKAADNAVRRLRLDSFRAEAFGSRADTPEAICESWAKQCDIFILIIGERYGYIIKSRGVSVVEFEYETAHAQDPGKILVYVKDGVNREVRLKEFLERLQDFEYGYFRSFFTSPADLDEQIQRDIKQWLTSQAKQDREA